MGPALFGSQRLSAFARSSLWSCGGCCRPIVWWAGWARWVWRCSSGHADRAISGWCGICSERHGLRNAKTANGRLKSPPSVRLRDSTLRNSSNYFRCQGVPKGPSPCVHGQIFFARDLQRKRRSYAVNMAPAIFFFHLFFSSVGTSQGLHQKSAMKVPGLGVCFMLVRSRFDDRTGKPGLHQHISVSPTHAAHLCAFCFSSPFFLKKLLAATVKTVICYGPSAATEKRPRHFS